MVLDGRIVALCDTHARAVELAGVETLAALRARYPEGSGRRSLLDRRSPLDRRILPPRPELRRRSSGRRSSDPVS
jgi:hypothetical protein